MSFFPDIPTDGPRASGTMALRFEDVTQGGHVTLECLPTAISTVVWPQLLRDFSVASTSARDVFPILSRLVIVSEGGPVSSRRKLDGTGAYALAASRGEDGSVERIFANMWVALDGLIGSTHDFPVENAGQAVRVGKVFAEHVFTRPFARPGQSRRVSALSLHGREHVPEAVHVWRGPQTVFTQDEGSVTWLDEEPSQDANELVLGLVHTDSNQHVNSLVYPRLFEEAALRRLAKHGHRVLRGTSIELLFRKPCFAGEALHVTLQVGRRGASFVARAYAHAPGESFDKARAYAWLGLVAA